MPRVNIKLTGYAAALANLQRAVSAAAPAARDIAEVMGEMSRGPIHGRNARIFFDNADTGESHEITDSVTSWEIRPRTTFRNLGTVVTESGGSWEVNPQPEELEERSSMPGRSMSWYVRIRVHTAREYIESFPHPLIRRAVSWMTRPEGVFYGEMFESGIREVEFTREDDPVSYSLYGDDVYGGARPSLRETWRVGLVANDGTSVNFPASNVVIDFPEENEEIPPRPIRTLGDFHSLPSTISIPREDVEEGDRSVVRHYYESRRWARDVENLRGLLDFLRRGGQTRGVFSRPHSILRPDPRRGWTSPPFGRGLIYEIGDYDPQRDRVFDGGRRWVRVDNLPTRVRVVLDNMLDNVLPRRNREEVGRSKPDPLYLTDDNNENTIPGEWIDFDDGDLPDHHLEKERYEMKNHKSQTVWKSRSNDEAFMANYEKVLRDRIALHLLAVEAVKEEIGFSDERAIQAAAFTVSKDALETVMSPGVVFYEPSEDPVQNLREFRFYQQSIEDPFSGFVKLTVQMSGGDATAEEVREAMTGMRILNRRTFFWVWRYEKLAEAVLAHWAGETELEESSIEEAWGSNLEKAREAVGYGQ